MTCQSLIHFASHFRIYAYVVLLAIALAGCGDGNRSTTTMPGATATCHDVMPSTGSAAPASATASATGHPTAQADRLMREGADAFSHGDFGQAAARFEQAATYYGDAGHSGDQCDALLNLATSYESLGSYVEAAAALTMALPLAQAVKDADRETDLLIAMGNIYGLTHNYEIAEQLIARGLQLAASRGNQHAVAKLWNDRGNLFASQGKYAEAEKAYRTAGNLAPEADLLTRARAMTNAALVLQRGAKFTEAYGQLEMARQITTRLADGREKANLLLTQGRIECIARKAEPHPELAVQASDSFVQAGRIAESRNDQLMLSFALGYQGELAETQKRDIDAMSLTRRALFLAQEAQSPHALYRWQWQVARLLRDQGQLLGAIEAYDNAIRTLQQIHGDLANGIGNQADAGSFRESVGPIYYQMADLLLRQADAEHNSQVVQSLLLKARQTVELLKSGELEDYFQRKCVNLLEQKRIEQIDAGTAVVYLIPLPDRTEMLVSTASGLKRFKSPIGSEELTREVREFRGRLEDRTSNRYLRNARKLYNWIIRPIEPTLQVEKIDTLVFVPDGALRTVPIAALNDGKQFLIARYAIAITPGLTLMAPRAASQLTQRTMLEGGLSQPIGGFPALEFVPQELGGIHHLFPGTQLLNNSFTSRNLTQEMLEHHFTFVHLASHAEFSHNENDTFLLVYPNSSNPSARKLTLKELGNLLRQTRFRDEPVELLALSACQTAAGDDRAALGLAGVAIAMGARSAVATLWSINDQASADLIQHFYQSLSTDHALSKAKAMRLAQMELLRDARYAHPCYWAPYLVIGNWL